jgi:DNA mismatch repair protein MutL
MGYGELVPRGRYPVAIVFVDVPGGDIDVNVHPQKLEVRFSDAPAVAAAVRHAVRQGVASAPWLAERATSAPIRMHAIASMAPPRRADDLAGRYASDTVRALFPAGGLGRAPERQGALALDGASRAGEGAGSWDAVRARVAARDAARGRGPRAAGRGQNPEPDVGLGPRAAGLGQNRDPGPRPGAAPDPQSDTATVSPTTDPELGPGTGTDAATSSHGGPRPEARGPRPLPDGPRPATRGPDPRSGTGTGTGTGTGADEEPAGFFARLRYLGQLDRTFLVCEGDGELVLVDQHAAHERVEFQRLRDRAAADGVAVQRLLFPTVLELPAAERALVADGADLLAAVGFDVEPFGGGAVAVKAVPAGLREDPAGVLRELLAELAHHGGSRAVEERLDHVLATVACHSVVRAGDVLAADEVRALLAQMDGVDFRAHCPHGRPVLLRVGVAELARRFGRT